VFSGLFVVLFVEAAHEFLKHRSHPNEYVETEEVRQTVSGLRLMSLSRNFSMSWPIAVASLRVRWNLIKEFNSLRMSCTFGEKPSK